MPFTATMDEQRYHHSESSKSKTEKEKYHITSSICRTQKEMIQMNLFTTETDSQTQRTDLWLPRRQNGKYDSQLVWNSHEHTAIFKKDNL